MIKKIKEILFNIVDYNRDGKISNTEFYTAILIVLIMYGLLILNIFVMDYLMSKIKDVLPF
tara:strand:- start:73 stop:255 length:183 start_codon:yes stop_codon:yes gene_type:complete